MPSNDIPRRIDVQQLAPEELSIRDAMIAVDSMKDAHPILTDVVMILMHAREKLADYVDEKIAAAQ